jgi:hypothetical protein
MRKFRELATEEICKSANDVNSRYFRSLSFVSTFRLFTFFQKNVQSVKFIFIFGAESLLFTGFYKKYSKRSFLSKNNNIILFEY